MVHSASKLIKIYRDITSKTDIHLAITGSLGLALWNFRVFKDFGDLDLTFKYSDYSDLEKFLLENYLNVKLMHFGFKVLNDGIEVDFIIDDNCMLSRKQQIGFLEDYKTGEFKHYTQDLSKNNEIGKSILVDLNVSRIEDTLQGKLYLCFNSKIHKRDHINELIAYLSNNIDILNGDKK